MSDKEVESKPVRSVGMSLPSVVLVVFVILKLVGLVAWSWVWVLSPLWIELLLWFFGVTLLTTAAALREWAERRTRP